MLVLSRKKSGTVIVDLGNGQLGTVTVVEIRGDKVRLGFDFPVEMRVDRSEVRERIQEQEGDRP